MANTPYTFQSFEQSAPLARALQEYVSQSAQEKGQPSPDILGWIFHSVIPMLEEEEVNDTLFGGSEALQHVIDLNNLRTQHLLADYYIFCALDSEAHRVGFKHHFTWLR